MKVICSKERLIKALGIAESVISTKISISILSNVLLEAKDSTLKISSCETRLSFFTEIGAEVIEPGSSSVYCNKFYSIIRKFPGDEVEITTDENNQFYLKPKGFDNKDYFLKGIDAEKFPPIKKLDESLFFSLPQTVFSEMVKSTIFAISMTESRRFVSGLYFERNNDSMRLVSTDGKRLSFINKNIATPDFVASGIIIPPKILTEALKLCSDEGDVKIAVDQKNIAISIDNYYFISNLLEANFPPYEKVIPHDQSGKFLIDRNKLHESIDCLSQIGDKESHKIIFSLSDNMVEIFTEDINHGSGKEVIPIEYSGEPMKIALNYLFITDVLNVIKKDTVIFEFKDSMSTVTIKEEGNDDFIYIMMPMSY